MTLSVTSLTVEVNGVSDSAAANPSTLPVVNFAGLPGGGLDVPTGPSSHTTLDFKGTDGQIVRASARIVQ